MSKGERYLEAGDLLFYSARDCERQKRSLGTNLSDAMVWLALLGGGYGGQCMWSPGVGHDGEGGSS